MSVILPDSLRFPDNLTEKLIVDCEYYKICDFNLSDLLNPNFLKFFVRSGMYFKSIYQSISLLIHFIGELTLLSINTRIDCDNCICITPGGHLILNINKETFQSLGLEGKVSYFARKNKDRYSK